MELLLCCVMKPSNLKGTKYYTALAGASPKPTDRKLVAVQASLMVTYLPQPSPAWAEEEQGGLQ